jgi:hypothetical protein
VVRYSGYGFAVLSLAAVAAFWPGYLSRPLATIDGTTHVHAAVMAAWCALLVAQPFLVRRGRVRVHRALGKLSYVLAPIIVVTALRLTQLLLQDQPLEALREGARYVYLPVSGALLFGASYALAMRFRRRSALHARFMVGTALSFVDPILSRIMAFDIPAIDARLYQPITFALTDVLLLVLIWRERRSGVVAGNAGAGFPVVLGLFAVAHLLWFTLATSDAWWHFVQRFAALRIA